MVRRLILDSNAIIAFERGAIDIATFDDDDIAIAAITVAEFRVGIEMARTAERAATRSRMLAVISDVVTILDYTERTAIEHARLLAYARRAGVPRGTHDLIIAAHAIEHARTIFSMDSRARFGALPGVHVIDSRPVPPSRS